jgi:hypothetical protein
LSSKYHFSVILNILINILDQNIFIIHLKMIKNRIIQNLCLPRSNNIIISLIACTCAFFLITGMVGLGTASKYKNKTGECDEEIHAIVVKIDDIFTPRRKIYVTYVNYLSDNVTGSLPYKHDIEKGDVVDIFSDCRLECYTGTQIFRINPSRDGSNLHWNPPTTNRYDSCVFAMGANAIVMLLSACVICFISLRVWYVRRRLSRTGTRIVDIEIPYSAL